MRGKRLGPARNPLRATTGQVRQARNLYKDFRGDDPQGLKKVRLPTPKTGVVIGELDGVLYTTVRDGKTEKYIHNFRKNSRPLLIAAHDGTSLHIVGGKYAFESRGIVDRK